ncbi:MAG: HAMP domain-containing sensor histidine kinase [Actinomycetota bacterium]
MQSFESSPSRRAGSVTATSAVVIGLTSVVVLVSWAVGAEVPTRILPQSPQMVPNTALALLLGAVALWHARTPTERESRSARAFRTSASIAVTAIGALTTFEYATGIDLHIDRIIPRALESGGTFPGRPSPQTAVALMLLGSALLLLDSRPQWRLPPAQLLALAGAAIGTIALTGYAFDTRGFYGTPDFLPYTGMAIHTAGATLLLGTGVLTSRPDVGIMHLFTSRGAGGRTLRLLLPAVIGAPFAVNFLALRGARAGYFTSSYALALGAVAAAAVLLFVAWLIAAATERADDRRRAVERALRNSRKTYRDAYVREQEATKRLREVDGMKNSFLQMVSHELRTPLTTVLGFSETLARPELGLSEEQMDFATRIASSARRLDSLVTDLLDVDRLSRGIFSPRRRPVTMAPLIDSVVATADLEDRPLDVQINPDATVAFLDPGQTGRILENLLINAVRHTPAGTPISVQVRTEAYGIVISVDDRGPGVPEEIRESIFQPFVRGTASAFVPGVGIGLSLVRQFAEIHGGKAWVEDRAGGGASFNVALPAWPPNDRRRVLMTSRPDGDAGIEDALREAGYEVALCVGSGESPACVRCPLVTDGSCALAEGAHIVVFTRDLSNPENLAVLRAYRAVCPMTPVIVQVDEATAARHSELLGGCEVVSEELDADRMVTLIRKVLGEQLASNAGG